MPYSAYRFVVDLVSDWMKVPYSANRFAVDLVSDCG